MRVARLFPLALLVAVSCAMEDDLPIGVTEQSLTATTSCLRGMIGLWDGPNYTGSHICLTGTGSVNLNNVLRIKVIGGQTYVFTWGHHAVRSWTSGSYTGALAADTSDGTDWYYFGPGEACPDSQSLSLGCWNLHPVNYVYVD